MFRKTLLTLLALIGLTTVGFAIPEAKNSIGVVNFANCMTESKLGKQEQSSFESIKNQMTSLLEDTEKQLNEIAGKFNDSEYMDGLSPEAEEEMKVRYQSLSEEMNRYQNQYYQVLNQANMKMIQTLGTNIQEAAEKVAQAKNLTMVVNKEACFFHNANLDVTSDVIVEMDRLHEKKNAQTANSAAPNLNNKQKS